MTEQFIDSLNVKFVFICATNSCNHFCNGEMSIGFSRGFNNPSFIIYKISKILRTILLFFSEVFSERMILNSTVDFVC